MNKFLPGAASKSSPSPELQEKIKSKKDELKALKTASKTGTAAEKRDVFAKIKAVNKELKVISPKRGTW
tara:strand:- start:178 stop:384 length:207 start_codon:yes stop_codon:yes gene_type:complete